MSPPRVCRHPSPALLPSHRILRFLRGADGGLSTFVQKSSICFVPTVAAVDEAFLISRFAAAVPWPRALPIAEFAPLSHMLMNGFFLVQGFFILITISGLV